METKIKPIKDKHEAEKISAEEKQKEELEQDLNEYNDTWLQAE